MCKIEKCYLYGYLTLNAVFMNTNLSFLLKIYFYYFNSICKCVCVCVLVPVAFRKGFWDCLELVVCGPARSGTKLEQYLLPEPSL